MSSPVSLHSADTTVAEIPGKGAVIAAGDTVPADGQIGFAPGCLFIQTDGNSVNTVLYANIGTNASCNFDALLGG